MTLYYVVQDNLSWCCHEDSGPYYEDHEESFVNCECELPDGKMTADHLHGCNGGGPVLQWREATEKELIAWVSGTQDGFGDHFDVGVEHERERIIALLETACKPNDHDYINGCNCDVIALIKGENDSANGGRLRNIQGDDCANGSVETVQTVAQRRNEYDKAIPINPNEL